MSLYVEKNKEISILDNTRSIYVCKCGKKYKSDSALCFHINKKHK
jgi:hypothetical protein